MGQRIGRPVAIVRLSQRVREGIVRRQVRAVQRIEIEARGVAQRREGRFVVGGRGHRERSLLLPLLLGPFAGLFRASPQPGAFRRLLAVIADSGDGLLAWS